MLTFWWDWWRAYWARPEPKPKPAALCTLDDLALAFNEYLESAKLTAERAAKNVEDANLLITALKENVEDGLRLKAALEDLQERKRQAAQAQCDSPPPQAQR